MDLKLTNKKSLLVATAVVSALTASTANATHFRGAAIVPSVDASGVLTVSAKSFWRRQDGTSAGQFPHSGIGSLSVDGGVGTITDISIAQDVSDTRRAEINEVFSAQLPGAGLYTISWSGTSWVGGVPNAGGGYGTTSTIFWDGQTANTPIQFDLENIQQQVVDGVAYSDNLDAIGSGLVYDDSFLSRGLSRQATGFSIDASGQIDIDAASIGTYPNTNSTGSDQAFSGKITSDDDSSIEFVWLFDKVTTASNLAPQITDVVINALVGDTINETLVVTDPDLDPITTSFISFIDTNGAVSGSSFNPATLQFNWDSTGFGVGTYIATFGASDGSLTDQGTVTINLANRPNSNPSVNEPGTLAIVGAGLLGLAGLRRKRKAK
ncbi:PEP-CTERM sorting domain-containing protein [Alteromonas oceanisediminis]|uniref:PEP-CTERM sorting domain-containing protein n=1 Tax=Alteromonas oceanisediminis TaxID=2836180 RepID=UPI001BDA7AC5|nr:PEP-CTERM sorting domain-containing protein [Alteromonas oceanisediminis]MBT0587048.1 PEP-CTERM sorting domain-containing protein [Alteromonas oceanisediminis]